MNKSFRLVLGALLAGGLVAMSPVLAMASFTVVPPDQTFAGKTYADSLTVQS
jgi:RsiW-degrading membrane proteinase PrsW (M82 family)